jgi:23S rRNA (guanosine2251-2'-O)-methyltransferase
MKSMKIIYGYRSVCEALKNSSRKTFRLFITEAKLKEIKNIPFLKSYENIEVVNIQQLNHLCGSLNHNSIAIEVKEFYTPKELKKLGNRIILLADVTDTGNLGAIIRSGGILGYDLIFSKNNSAPINGTVAKNAAGGLEHMEIHACNSLLQTCKLLKKDYYFLVGATEKELVSTNINFNNLPDKICLIMGGENTGIPKSIKDELDFVYSVPGKKEFNVFNVSVAAALCMFNLRKN